MDTCRDEQSHLHFDLSLSSNQPGGGRRAPVEISAQPPSFNKSISSGNAFEHCLRERLSE